MSRPQTHEQRLLCEAEQLLSNAAHTHDERLCVLEAVAAAKSNCDITECSTYYIKDVMVHVIQASFGSMREKGGIYTFARNITSGIESVLSIPREIAHLNRSN